MLDQVAVFVDGDNVGADHATQIESLAVKLGDPILQRVYGDIVRMPKWQKQSSFAMVHSGTGKNATDILITIDAVEVALSGTIQTVLIASSDSDYRHLAFRLRERGVSVVAMGEAETKATFRNACTDFVELPPVKTALRPVIRNLKQHPWHVILTAKSTQLSTQTGQRGTGLRSMTSTISCATSIKLKSARSQRKIGVAT